jgi:hypothetical protein
MYLNIFVSVEYKKRNWIASQMLSLAYTVGVSITEVTTLTDSLYIHRTTVNILGFIQIVLGLWADAEGVGVQTLPPFLWTKKALLSEWKIKKMKRSFRILIYGRSFYGKTQHYKPSSVEVCMELLINVWQLYCKILPGFH